MLVSKEDGQECEAARDTGFLDFVTPLCLLVMLRREDKWPSSELCPALHSLSQKGSSDLLTAQSLLSHTGEIRHPPVYGAVTTKCQTHFSFRGTCI